MLNKYHGIIYLFLSCALAQDSSFTFQENDYVNIPNAGTIQPVSAMTIECWINPDQTGYSNFDPVIKVVLLSFVDKITCFLFL